MRTRVKFCGCTSVEDVQQAVACGVDAIGVIFAAASPRRVSIQRAVEIANAVPAFVSLVGVFVEPSAANVAAVREAGYTPQFSGHEAASFCEASAAGRYLKVHHVQADAPAALVAETFRAAARAYTHATWMFDTAVNGKLGGTGRTFDWSALRELAGERPIVIGGGLTPENVGSCVRIARPYGVDVRSGIETGGVQDLAKMRAFVRAVKEADEQA